MRIKPPNVEDLKAIAQRYGSDLTDQDAPAYLGFITGIMASYERLDALAAPSLPVKYPRTAGHQPDATENRLGAWAWRGEIVGAAEGPLAGKTVAVKDNIAVAGWPLRNGTAVLEGYVPDVDATVVTRVLDAGGTVLGKANCESLCFSGGSHTSDLGPVKNPYDPTRSTGGSSSGSAALVAVGAVDMALGGDQGGSIRIPSGWCGIYGLKPTYGLVPYTGAFPIEMTLDHLGPMARTVADVALLLEVIAGPDGLDPRQRSDLLPKPYTRALTGDVRGLRVAVVEEGFDWPGLSEADVDARVEEAAQAFARLGALVERVSIPLHRDGIHIWNAIGLEGATLLMVAGNGMGTNWKGHYTTGLLDAFAAGRAARSNDLPDTVKLTVLLGQYMQDRYHGHYYARGQNLARRLRAAYDDVLQSFDLLAMPTLPMKATKLPGPDATREEYLMRALEMIANTCPFDVTGHPAMNVPCAMSEGLPVGMMLVGRWGEDDTVLRAADAFARHVFSPPPPPA
jgi:amidase